MDDFVFLTKDCNLSLCNRIHEINRNNGELWYKSVHFGITWFHHSLYFRGGSYYRRPLLLQNPALQTLVYSKYAKNISDMDLESGWSRWVFLRHLFHWCMTSSRIYSKKLASIVEKSYLLLNVKTKMATRWHTYTVHNWWFICRLAYCCKSGSQLFLTLKSTIVWAPLSLLIMTFGI